MMSSKLCAKCDKNVYPVEEMKCLDKIWHKSCFKCQVCNMTLSMRNYKGFDKLPYCEAHVPKAKATIVADTPEMKRLAENSKIQSNVKYHAEFEASKGKFTTIADDPETMRIKANTQTISNISYHGVVEQKAEQEKKRSLIEDGAGPVVGSAALGNGHPVGPDGSGGVAATAVRSSSVGSMTPYGGSSAHPAAHNGRASVHAMPQSMPPLAAAAPQSSYSQQHSIQARSQPARPVDSVAAHHPSRYSQQQHQPQPAHPGSQSKTLMGGGPAPHPMGSPPNAHYQQQPQPQRYISASSTSSRPAGQPSPGRAAQSYRHGHGQAQQLPAHVALHHQQQQPQPQPGPQQQQQPQPQHYSRQAQPSYMASGQQQYGQPSGRVSQQPGHHYQPSQQPSQHLNRCYRAVYDYKAQDTDEVSFEDGDIIVNCTPVDEGWMTGTVHRTGHFGMLPANYVEPINL